ncbi:hypothetical protein P245_10155 [Comamonas thiooxydans]|uniref:Uncharacterized protein n=2 Tax=Comamonas thiooxydans TaxID=363952 RepID=A0A0E3BHR4_9BURK|nr:hypothetical protein P245_10155 [Comamonas thiooxydans]
MTHSCPPESAQAIADLVWRHVSTAQEPAANSRRKKTAPECGFFMLEAWASSWLMQRITWQQELQRREQQERQRQEQQERQLRGQQERQQQEQQRQRREQQELQQQEREQQELPQQEREQQELLPSCRKQPEQQQRSR